jgi:AP2-like factor, euAP2 lineage
MTNTNIRKQSGSTSKFRGVGRHARGWRARITTDQQEDYLGYFKDEIEAARAYDREAINRYGPDAITNVSLGLLEVEANQK